MLMDLQLWAEIFFFRCGEKRNKVSCRANNFSSVRKTMTARPMSVVQIIHSAAWRLADEKCRKMILFSSLNGFLSWCFHPSSDFDSIVLFLDAVAEWRRSLFVRYQMLDETFNSLTSFALCWRNKMSSHFIPTSTINCITLLMSNEYQSSFMLKWRRVATQIGKSLARQPSLLRVWTMRHFQSNEDDTKWMLEWAGAIIKISRISPFDTSSCLTTFIFATLNCDEHETALFISLTTIKRNFHSDIRPLNWKSSMIQQRIHLDIHSITKEEENLPRIFRSLSTFFSSHARMHTHPFLLRSRHYILQQNFRVLMTVHCIRRRGDAKVVKNNSRWVRCFLNSINGGIIKGKEWWSDRNCLMSMIKVSLIKLNGVYCRSTTSATRRSSSWLTKRTS